MRTSTYSKGRKHLPYALAAIALFFCVLTAAIFAEWGGAKLAGRSFHPTSILAAEAESGPLPAERYAEIAAAFRDGELERAEDLLADLPADERATLGDVELLLGLAAWSLDDEEAAAEHLADAGADAGLLGDWRLWTLAELATAEDDDATALAHYAELARAYPSSPLYPGALLAAARLHSAADQPRQALALIEQARRDEVAGEIRVELEELAWRIGRELGDDAVRREAARRLLVHSPWTANTLGVTKVLRQGDGDLDWNAVLSPADLVERARTFLSLEQASAALGTLDDVARAGRGLDWHLVKAEALIRLHDAEDALETLDAAPVRDASDRAAVEWQRALATADLATASGGGKRLTEAQRRQYRDASIRHLSRVAELGEDVDLAVRALRRLYADLDDEGFERQKPVLQELRRFDPTDRTGADPLWEKGWKEYQSANFSSAAAYWTELSELYPDDRQAHRGRYWKARAFEELGERRRAREIYEELVATSDTNDFYRTQALARLGEEPQLTDVAQAAVGEIETWKIDPRLERAKLLTDLGLDELAKREIEIVDTVYADVEQRDQHALEALMTIRGGKSRAGIAELKRAFPELGGAAQGEIPTEILRAFYPFLYEDTIRAEAEEAGLPAHLVAGIVRQESVFDTRATSPVGARGLMQVMPATGKEVATSLGMPYSAARLYDPAYSVRLGSTYFSRVLDMFDGNVELALAGYNGGPYRIQRMWKEQGADRRLDDFFETLPIDESRNYVKRILVWADSYRQLYPGDASPLDT
ncbi:MAG TPA: transglycosylase SLT domain-containing protein [Thermoanaerobaculia bacterium]|nr:transglycosylase SLT domain-containing protein [Thermoanaerobaculia bacterium]